MNKLLTVLIVGCLMVSTHAGMGISGSVHNADQPEAACAEAGKQNKLHPIPLDA